MIWLVQSLILISAKSIFLVIFVSIQVETTIFCLFDCYKNVCYGTAYSSTLYRIALFIKCLSSWAVHEPNVSIYNYWAIQQNRSESGAHASGQTFMHAEHFHHEKVVVSNHIFVTDIFQLQTPLVKFEIGFGFFFRGRVRLASIYRGCPIFAFSMATLVMINATALARLVRNLMARLWIIKAHLARQKKCWIFFFFWVAWFLSPMVLMTWIRR